MASSSTTNLLESVRQQFVDRGGHSLKQVIRRFGAYDTDRDKKITLEEFSSAVEAIGIELTPGETMEVFRAFDRNSNGSLDVNEFITAMRPPMNASRQAIILEAFKKCDVTGDGVITLADLTTKYDVTKHPKFQTGEWTKTQVLKQFLDQFQPGSHVKDDKVTQQEFLDYYAIISAHIDKDVYFDYMIRQAWKL